MYCDKKILLQIAYGNFQKIFAMISSERESLHKELSPKIIATPNYIYKIIIKKFLMV